MSMRDPGHILVDSRAPGGILVLRRGDTVLFADYYGEQDLSEHIEHFAQMLMDL